MPCAECCFSICDNLSFCTAQVKAKFKDDLLIGTEHSKKILPACQTPQNSIEHLSQDDKVQILGHLKQFELYHLDLIVL